MFCGVPSTSAVPSTIVHGADADDVVVVSSSGPVGAGWDAAGVVHATEPQSTIPSPIKLRMISSCSTVRHLDADRRVGTLKTPSACLARRVAGASDSHAKKSTTARTC
jgi:hypothetical protein